PTPQMTTISSTLPPIEDTAFSYFLSMVDILTTLKIERTMNML
ncbi:5367_t:CDS:1, partial [Dentiscutata heterogama]